MKTQHNILCMDTRQASQLKYQWDIFTHDSVGRVYPYVG